MNLDPIVIVALIIAAGFAAVMLYNLYHDD